MSDIDKIRQEIERLKEEKEERDAAIFQGLETNKEATKEIF